MKSEVNQKERMSQAIPNANCNIAITSIAGGSTKTTLAKNLFTPLLPNSVFIAIEDWNAGDGTADLEISAKSFYTTAAQINVDDEQSFVLDIGASNSREMLRNFADLELTREAIDFWVIPVRSGAKERLDSLKTMQLLTQMDIASERIILIASAVTDVNQFDSEFGALKKAAVDSGMCFAEQVVLFNQVFDMLKGGNESVFDIVANKPDFKSMKLQCRGNEARLMEIGQQMVTYSLCLTAARNLRAVFESTPIANALRMEG